MDKSMINVERVCMVEFNREICYANYDENRVTISQDRTIKNIAAMSNIIKFFPAETFDEDLKAYLLVIKNSIDPDVRNLIQISISTPSVTTETTQNRLVNLYFYNIEYIIVSDI